MPDHNPSFTPGRKWRIGFSVTIAALSALALALMANYLAARHSVRYNWSDSSANKLSPLTVRALNSLTNDVKVIVFFDRNEPLFGAVTALIKDYQLRTPRLKVEMVDYHYPGRAAVIRADYKLTSPGEQNRIIFDCNGRVRSVLASELSDYAVGPDRQFRRSAFKGEQLFTSALISVTAPRRTKAYFLSGHGEHSPESSDDQIGYGRLAKMMAEGDVEVDIFESLASRDVPADCSLLVIAGPATRFGREELERLDRYLAQGGRMFLLFSSFDYKRPLTGLEGLMAAWNVDVGANMVRDAGQGKANGDFVVVASQFGPHPVTRALLRSSLNLVAPRSVGARAATAARADAPRATELVLTSAEGVALGRIDDKGMAEAERSGAIPLAVAVEKGGIQGVAADRGATRIIVVGSSFSFANAVLNYAGNADFANLAVSWLLNRDVLLQDIPPRAVADHAITVTDRQMSALRWALLAGAPGVVLALGGIVWLRRRS